MFKSHQKRFPALTRYGPTQWEMFLALLFPLSAKLPAPQYQMVPQQPNRFHFPTNHQIIQPSHILPWEPGASHPCVTTKPASPGHSGSCCSVFGLLVCVTNKLLPISSDHCWASHVYSPYAT